MPKYCCKTFNEMVNRFSFIKEHNPYEEKERYFEVTIGRDLDKGDITQDIYYCPFCAKKLPIPYDINDKNITEWGLEY